MGSSRSAGSCRAPLPPVATTQYLSIRSTERLAGTINGLFKAEVIHRRGPWRSFEAVKRATLEWDDWYDNRRPREPVGNQPPADAEAAFCTARETRDVAA
tara:strand:- start:206 stop:505 length:300 start_codon:yes stop_codon:yes gene_type:complete